LVFAVLSLGWRTAFGYLVASLIFSHFLTKRFADKLQDQAIEISQPIVATALIDLPILCLIAFAIISFYDSHRTKKEAEGRQILKEETQKQEKLSRSYRDKALIEMAGGIAHEINNPLFAISGSVEQSLKDPNIDQLNPVILNKLKRVKKHSQRIHQLIERLLEFSSIDSHQEDAVDARIALTESLGLNQVQIKSENINIEIQGDAPKLQIDLFSLMKIYNSLISNSIYECKHKNFKESWIHFHFSKDDTYGFIDVIDPGTGVSPSVAAKLFNPFFTTREIGHGSGLGLSEARGLARSFKGDINYHLNSGHTCFRISLPLETNTSES
jgi:two-component system sensor kinase FixL